MQRERSIVSPFDSLNTELVSWFIDVNSINTEFGVQASVRAAGRGGGASCWIPGPPFPPQM